MTTLFRILITVITVSLAGVVACEDDPVEPPPPPPVQKFENLSQRWHVLNNVEFAYNKRDLTKYDELLDENFIFVLSPGDVGGPIPAQWGRVEEILYNSRLLDPNYSGPRRCKRIDMNIVLPDDKSVIPWVEVPARDMSGETWYSATIFYLFRFDTEPDLQFESPPGAKAEFVVRNAGTQAAPQWRLVEMHDNAKTFFAAQVSTETTTWGEFKAFYITGPDQ